MIKIDIENIIDIRNIVVEIWKNCPHVWADEDIISEIEKGIDGIRKLVKKGKEGKICFF